MPKAAWLTDIHLGFITPRKLSEFADRVRGEDPDVVLIGGDTGEAHTVVGLLKALEDELQRPIYFVLGNHDYYRGSIAEVRAAAERLSHESRSLTWLPAAGVVALSPTTGLIGHGGWADGRLGDFDQSPHLLNDYLLIQELTSLSDSRRLERLHQLGDEAGAYFRRWLPEVLARYARVIVLTHVPPFRDACWHAGRVSDDEHLPHFSSAAAGQPMLDAMRQRPDAELTVLCGHTHGSGQVRMLPNLQVLTGEAQYGAPTIQRVLQVD